MTMQTLSLRLVNDGIDTSISVDFDRHTITGPGAEVWLRRIAAWEREQQGRDPDSRGWMSAPWSTISARIEHPLASPRDFAVYLYVGHPYIDLPEELKALLPEPGHYPTHDSTGKLCRIY